MMFNIFRAEFCFGNLSPIMPFWETTKSVRENCCNKYMLCGLETLCCFSSCFWDAAVENDHLIAGTIIVEEIWMEKSHIIRGGTISLKQIGRLFMMRSDFRISSTIPQSPASLKSPKSPSFIEFALVISTTILVHGKNRLRSHTVQRRHWPARKVKILPCLADVNPCPVKAVCFLLKVTVEVRAAQGQQLQKASRPPNEGF